MKTEWLETLESWCNELASLEYYPGQKKLKEIEGYIIATAMLAAGYEWSTEKDRYVKTEV